LSGLRYGATHTGVDADKGSGDVFIWSDKFKLYDTKSNQNVYFYNYSPNYIKEERDYHLSAKPSYTTYTYPHPLSNIVITDIDRDTETGSINSYKIYPNPAAGGTLNINSESPLIEGTLLEMVDLAGVTVKKTEMNSNLMSVNVRDLASGVYLVKISNSKETHINKIVVVN
jgi:hypothetical protein